MFDNGACRPNARCRDYYADTHRLVASLWLIWNGVSINEIYLHPVYKWVVVKWLGAEEPVT